MCGCTGTWVRECMGARAQGYVVQVYMGAWACRVCRYTDAQVPACRCPWVHRYMGTLVHRGVGAHRYTCAHRHGVHGCKGPCFHRSQPPWGRAALGLFCVLLPDRLTCQPSDCAGTGQAHLAKLSPFGHLGLFQGGVCLEAGLARHMGGWPPDGHSSPCPKLCPAQGWH